MYSLHISWYNFIISLLYLFLFIFWVVILSADIPCTLFWESVELSFLWVVIILLEADCMLPCKSEISDDVFQALIPFRRCQDPSHKNSIFTHVTLSSFYPEEGKYIYSSHFFRVSYFYIYRYTACAIFFSSLLLKQSVEAKAKAYVFCFNL